MKMFIATFSLSCSQYQKVYCILLPRLKHFCHHNFKFVAKYSFLLTVLPSEFQNRCLNTDKKHIVTKIEKQLPKRPKTPTITWNGIFINVDGMIVNFHWAWNCDCEKSIAFTATICQLDEWFGKAALERGNQNKS